MIHQSRTSPPANNIFAKLAEEKISRLFWQYALPAIVGTSVTPLYNIINGVFIGHWIGEDALSATGAILPVMTLAAATGMLVGAGSATRISIYLGQKDLVRAEKIAGTSLLLTLLLSSLTLALLYIFMKPILMFAGASETTYPYARDFLQIFLPGSMFLTLTFNYNSMMRASGYPLKAMVTMFISVIANVILAPVFILFLGWGMRGAAIATTLSMATCFVFVMMHFLHKDSTIRLRLRNIRLRLDIVKSIVSIGFSPFCMQIASSAVIIFLNIQIRLYAPVAGISGDAAIAAFSNTNRLITLIVMVVIGLNQGMQPIIGYNYGAKNFGRIKETLVYAIKAATAITSVGFVLGFFFPKTFSSAFTPSPEIISLSATVLRYVTLSFVIVGFQMVVTIFFQCIGMARISIFLSLTRQVIFLVPLLWILPLFMGLDGVWLANPISDVASAILAGVILRYQFMKLKAHQQQMQEVTTRKP